MYDANKNFRLIRDFFIHPVQVPRWPFSFAPEIKTKFKNFKREIKKCFKNSPWTVDFPQEK